MMHSENGGSAAPHAAHPTAEQPAEPALIDELVTANHILFDQGVVDAFGHVSVRHSNRPDRFFLAHNIAPGRVTPGDILEYGLDGEPVRPDGRRLYAERFIHSEIYREYPEVAAVVHSHSHAIVPLSTIKSMPLRPLFHMAGFIGAGAPVFDIRDVAGAGTDLLISSRPLGQALAQSFKSSSIVLMRGHGSTVIAPSLRQAVYRAVYAEINARYQIAAAQLGDPTYLTVEEAKACQTSIEGHVRRPWDLWKQQAEERRRTRLRARACASRRAPAQQFRSMANDLKLTLHRLVNRFSLKPLRRRTHNRPAPDRPAAHANRKFARLIQEARMLNKKHRLTPVRSSATTIREIDMGETLGTMEELPEDYREAMSRAGVAPLWPMMRNLLPHGKPNPVTRAGKWTYADVRPLLLRAGELTPVEKAERRVLVLSDPGRGVGAMQATASIYIGLQLLMPGEVAPAHRHTASAARIIVEGEGGFTVVNGEKLPMLEGDLVLTPGGQWHDHGHDGGSPVIWLDALDLPLFAYLEGSYAEEAPLQAKRNRPDASQVEYSAAGLVPTRRNGQRAAAYPLMRFPWARTETALKEFAAFGGPGLVELDYINPETGHDVLPTMGFTAMMIRPGEQHRPPLRSASAVFHVVKGRGKTIIDGRTIEWSSKDTFSAPVFAEIDHVATDQPAFLVRIHDRPLQEKLGYYEERAR